MKPTDTADHFDNYLISIAGANQIAVYGLETDSLMPYFFSCRSRYPNSRDTIDITSPLVSVCRELRKPIWSPDAK